MDDPIGQSGDNTASIEDAVLTYFRNKIALPDERSAALAVRYTEQGLLDSTGVVMAMLDLEARFGISFNDTQIASPEFETIGGIVALIEAARDDASD